MRVTQTNIVVDRYGRRYKRMSLEQRAELRKRYVAAIPRWRYPIVGYIVAIPLVALMVGSVLYLRDFVSHFLFAGSVASLAVLIVALFWGVGPAIFALILSTVALDYYYIPPTRGLSIITWEGLIQFLPFIVSGLTIALITVQREQARLNALSTEQELQSYAGELEIINQKLEEANQMKDHFLSVASHELKTPITTIRGQAQLLLRRLGKAKQKSAESVGMENALERINEQTGRLTALIDELLDVSSMRAGKVELRKKQCDLCELCRSVIEDQRLLSGRHIALEEPAESIEVQVDGDRLAQVLTNLISNALKYSPEGSPVEVAIKSERGHILIQVRDYGRGIAKDQQEHIFETFYRTPDAQSSSKSGLGLGLAISKDIVERHSGRIWCESERGKGSTFFVDLPVEVGARA